MQYQRTISEYQNVFKLYGQEINRWQIHLKTGLPYTTIRYWINGRNKKPIEATRKFFIPPKKISPNIAYIFGVLKGDGFLRFYHSKDKTRIIGGKIALFVKDKDFAINFKNKLEKITRMNCSITKKYYKTRVHKKQTYAFSIELASINVVNYFKNLSLDNIKNSTKKIKCAFLRGFFDSEGGVEFFIFKSSKTRRIKLYNTNYELLVFCSELLSSLEIKNKIKKRKIYNKKWAQPYFLIIYSKNYITKFQKEIGFSIQRKQEKLEELLRSYKPIYLYTENQ